VLALAAGGDHRRCVHAVAANMHASARSAYFKCFCSTLASLSLQATRVRALQWSLQAERGDRAGNTGMARM
jgi:hypothetical protein